MKTKIFCCLSIIILLTCACKKSTTNPATGVKDGVDITKAINSGVLFGTWIINDEDVSKQKETQNSQVFTNKARPELTFNKDKTYQLNYTDSITQKPVYENGTWSINTAMNTIILKGPAKEYSFTISTLNEEDLIFNHEIQTTKTVTNAEGVTSAQPVTAIEILYLEDND